MAAYYGLKDTLTVFLSAGADANSVTPSGKSLLYAAIESGRDDVVHMLLDAGASVTHVSPHGETPLHLAASLGHAKITWDLLEHGAEPTATTPTYLFGLFGGQTPADLAFQYGHGDVVSMLQAAAPRAVSEL
jgi:ankyrin repeat protein